MGASGYSDFTNIKATVEPGKEYDLEVTTRWENWRYISIQAWIDWNGDASFDETERVLHQIGKTPMLKSILVPNNAPFGETRMRIRYGYDTVLGPCEYREGFSGEIEDYTVSIVNPNRPDAKIKASHRYIDDDKDLIEFADASTNSPTSWHWEFEGGIPSISTEQYPLVRYIRGGSFSVKLIVENEFGTDEVFYNNYITVDLPDPIAPPVSNFSTELRYVTDENQYVRFDDLSTNNPTSWYWEFEGATPATSTEQIPQVKYNESGNYSVKLTVTNDGGSNVKLIEDYITVNLSGICSSINERPNGQYITLVEFGRVSNNTTYTNGYEFYDFDGASLEKGPYTNTHEAGVMQIKVNNAWEDTKVGYWVDWNQDGDFDDIGEEKILNKATPTTKEWTFFLPVPESAKLGQTILRVRTIHSWRELLPCGNMWLGETEDYKINIIESDRRGKNEKSTSSEVAEVPITEKITVTPNPSLEGIFNFSELTGDVNFRVYNTNGIEVYNTVVNAKGNVTSLDLSALKFGLYTIQVLAEDRSHTFRVIIGE